MPVTFKPYLFLIVTLFLVSPVIAEEASSDSVQEKYVNITLEINGLGESATQLKKATLSLAKKLNQMDPDPENMTVEQLQSLGSVMEEANRLIQSIEQVKPAIEGLKEPTMNLVSNILTVFHRSTIEPAIQSIDDSVSKWIIITFLSILLLLVVVGCYFYWASTQIRSIAATLKSITVDYEIVPKRLEQKKDS
jgi:hypothetical protein